jgi:predicted O-methyltransferase YrrM
MMLNTLNKFPERPWISYEAAAKLKSFMKEAPRSALEFGSGNSSLWFAKRAAVLHSVEHNPEWHRKVQNMLSSTKARALVVHELHHTVAKYSIPRANNPCLWDIILIDGIWRLAGAQHHVDRLAPHGILYIDNSDANTSSDIDNEIPEFLAFLDDWARRTTRTVEIFTDFSPTALHPPQGILYTSWSFSSL